MEHFAFPGNKDFVADSQGAFSCLFMKSWCVYSSSVKQCLRSVNLEQFSIQMTHNSSTTSGCNSSPSKIFHRNSSWARTPTWNSAWTTKEKTSTRKRGAERTSLTQRKQRRQQEAEEQRNRRLEYPRHSGWKSLPLFFSQMNLRIHIKYSSTRLKQCGWRRKTLQHY